MNKNHTLVLSSLNLIIINTKNQCVMEMLA